MIPSSANYHAQLEAAALNHARFHEALVKAGAIWDGQDGYIWPGSQKELERLMQCAKSGAPFVPDHSLVRCQKCGHITRKVSAGPECAQVVVTERGTCGGKLEDYTLPGEEAP